MLCCLMDKYLSNIHIQTSLDAINEIICILIKFIEQQMF